MSQTIETNIETPTAPSTLAKTGSAGQNASTGQTVSIGRVSRMGLQPRSVPKPILRTDGSPLRVAFTTLGCKLNQYESDSIAAEFKAAGYEVGDFERDADVQIVNTCTVTDRADRKSRNAINRATRLLTPLKVADGLATLPEAASPNSGAEPKSARQITSASGPLDEAGKARIVVLTGCYVEGERGKLESDGRTIVVPNEQKSGIFSLVDAVLRGEMEHPAGPAPAVSGDASLQVFAYKATDTSFHARGTVKVQDGCDNFCTFCIIPFVRGRANSRPLPEVLDNVREIVENGVHEIVLSGVNMSRYTWEPAGTENPGTEKSIAPCAVRFAGLVQAILELPGDFRVRISSIEPDQLGPDFVQLFKHPKMCPQLHLCLQSGSDRILLAMRRQYNVAEYRNLVKELRAINPDFAISTDIIVGFPGETETDFEASLQLARKAAFSQIHVFPYSVRSGTRAERMPGKLSHAEIDRRADRLKELAIELKRARRAAAIDTIDRMIVERVEVDSAARKVRLSGTGLHFFPLRLELDADEVDKLLGAGESDPTSLRTLEIQVRVTGIERGDDPSLSAKPYFT